MPALFIGSAGKCSSRLREGKVPMPPVNGEDHPPRRFERSSGGSSSPAFYDTMMAGRLSIPLSGSSCGERSDRPPRPTGNSKNHLPSPDSELDEFDLGAVADQHL